MRSQTSSAPDASGLPPQPVPNWSKLSRNDHVQVLHRDGRVTSGRIEMIAVDRSVFWVIQEAGQGRLMVCRSDKPRVIKRASSAAGAGRLCH